jgi:LPS export ABC transporter protein LptC
MLRSKIFVFFVVLFGAFAFVMREDVAQNESLDSYGGNEIKFQDAEFTGEDNENRDYLIKAKEAESVSQDRYLLNSVDMSYDLKDEGKLSLIAKEGEYDKKQQIFIGIGDVKVALQGQYLLTTNKLSAQLHNKLIYTDESVTLEGDGLFVRSDKGIEVDIKKKMIECHGPVYSKFVES